MSQYTFSTREYGPSPKGETLTWEDLDYSLLFLSESINEISINPLSGSNYTFVEASGTPSQNGLSLSASYALAKTYPLSSTNRFTILAGTGKYEFNSTFILDTQYIDIVSLTGERDILVTGSNTVSITANDVYVRGIDVGTKNFTIADNLPLLKVNNCKGGDLSFGGTANPSPGNPPLTQILVNGTFVNCEGGDLSFAGNGILNGTFENCIGGESSFGYNIFGGSVLINCKGEGFSFGGAEGNVGGYLENCVGDGEGCFTVTGNILAGAVMKNCTGGANSFASNGYIEGKLYGCRLTFLSSFSNLNISGNGAVILCINSDNSVITYP